MYCFGVRRSSLDDLSLTGFITIHYKQIFNIKPERKTKIKKVAPSRDGAGVLTGRIFLGGGRGNLSHIYIVDTRQLFVNTRTVIPLKRTFGVYLDRDLWR